MGSAGPSSEDVAFLARRAEHLENLGLTDHALEYLEQHGSLLENDPHLANHYSVLLAKSGRLPDAIAVLERRVADPECPYELHYNLGNYLHDAGRLDEAIEVYLRVLHLFPGDGDTLISLGTAYSEVGDPMSAAEVYREHLREFGPVSSLVQCNLGLAHSQLGQVSAAELCYRRAVELSPEYELAWWNLGQLLRRFGRFGESLEALEAVCKLNPKNRSAIAYRSYLRRRVRSAASASTTSAYISDGLSANPDQ